MGGGAASPGSACRGPGAGPGRGWSPGPAPALTSWGPRLPRGPAVRRIAKPVPGRLAARAGEVEAERRAVDPP